MFSNVTGFKFDGNLGLCRGISELRLPPCPQESIEHRQKKHHFILVVVTTSAGIILNLTLMLIFCTIRNKFKPRAQSVTTEGFQFIDGNHPRVSYGELVQGTSGFTTENLIGRGRYGSVYKCRLLLDNMMIMTAVKVFDLQQSGSTKSFLSECDALSKIRHRNLVTVITCCSSSENNQIDFKALVFELMPNGSLDRWLHQDLHVSQELQGLTLIQRIHIAIDVGDALDYLHNGCEPPIIHCDIKPSNILLDNDLVARIGDFGLAKILSDSASEQPIDSKSSIGIRGTIGYVAPEYGEGGQVSPSGDVYSFGIVILELFTGMSPTHDMFTDGLTLQKHAENAFPGMLMEIVDPVLLRTEEDYASTSQGGSNTMKDIKNAMLSIMEVALSCSKHTPVERMNIRDAAAGMRKIRDKFINNATPTGI